MIRWPKVALYFALGLLLILLVGLNLALTVDLVQFRYAIL